ncbi:MAG: hypothetical protein OEO18_05270 [Gammaproteobacteria bacterium]|nr:hypothetical protein [Gammaproteobacteria bacterium]
MIDNEPRRDIGKHARRPCPRRLRSAVPKWRRSLALALLLGLAGCATIQQPHRGHLGSEDAAIRECARWFKALDKAVARSDVTDIASRRIAGYPYLRVDRFLAAVGGNANDEAFREAWIERMRELDAEGRRVEIDNLPAAEVERLALADRGKLVLRTRDCATRLSMIDLPDAAPSTLLEQRARVEDDYSSIKRAFGLYLLTRLPFYKGVQDWQKDVTQTIRAARRGESPREPVLRYLPPASRGYTRREVAGILARAARHPFGIPDLSETEKDRLFATYAPVFEIETGGVFDRIGKLYWSLAATPQVDVSNPTVYRRLGYTRFENRTLLQLIYVAWMPERPRDHAFDLLGGHLDGIVWRVTLAPDGEPVIYDSIHPCGCFHLFFPTPRVEPIPSPRRYEEWAFSPAGLPATPRGSRIIVSLQTRTHYLRNTWPGEPGEGTAYRFADYDELRSLPLPGGGSRSLFAPDGLVAGSERRERFLFWPMGIASAGAMRQAGTQATAFVGRRHFDDADLIEKRFRLRDWP